MAREQGWLYHGMRIESRGAAERDALWSVGRCDTSVKSPLVWASQETQTQPEPIRENAERPRLSRQFSGRTVSCLALPTVREKRLNQVIQEKKKLKKLRNYSLSCATTISYPPAFNISCRVQV